MSKLLFLLILLFLMLATPGMALACGGFVSPQGSNVQSQNLLAALVLDKQAGGDFNERLVIQLDYRVNQGSVQNFGWVMPVPNKPEVAAAQPDLFERLRVATKPKENYLDKLFGVLKPKSLEGTLRGPGATSAAGGGVTVVSQTRVGAFDISVVSASEQTALSKWASDNGYNAPILNTEAVKDYLTAKWFFVLAKLAATDSSSSKNSPVAGQSQPVLLTFSTREPIYPWRLSAYGPDGQPLNRSLPAQIYTLQPSTKLAPKLELPGAELRYAEQLDAPQSTELLKDLPGNNSQPYFLTSYHWQTSTGNMQTADLTFKEADNKQEIGTGKLEGGQWVLAILGTLFYGQIALLAVLGVLFTSDLVGIIVGLALVGLAAAFVIPRKPRRIALVVLAAINLVLGTGMIFGVVGDAPAALVSIVPLGALLAWAIWAGFFKKKILNKRVEER